MHRRFDIDFGAPRRAALGPSHPASPSARHVSRPTKESLVGIQTLQVAALALGPGAMLGLLALGIVLIYRGTGTLNLAHGSQAALGGFVYWDATVGLGLSPALALVVAIVVSGLCGVLIQVLVMRRLAGASPLTHLIASAGVLIVIQSLLLLRYGSNGRNVPSLLPTGPVPLGGEVTIGLDRLLLIVVALVVMLALWLLYRFTTFGIATAASAENAMAGAALGHDPNRLAMGNWFLGGALAGLAGALLAPISGLDLTTMLNLIVPALGAALFGGLVSFPLTVLGGIVIVLAQSQASLHIPLRGASTIATFVIIVGLMVLRGRSIPLRGFLGARLPALGSGRIRWPIVGGVLVVGLVLIWLVLPDVWNDALLTSMLVAVVMLSIVVVTGFAGQLSLAQFALAGVGAVIASLLGTYVGLPFPLLLLAAAVGAVPVGILLALPATRMRGASLAVVTLAFNVLLAATVFSRAQVITVPRPSLFGLDLSPILHPERYLTLVVVVFAVLALAVANLRRSRTGRRFVAVRGNERAAAAVGIDVARVKISAFAISAVIAAIGGVLLAFRTTSVVWTDFDVLGSVDQLAWTVIGGVGFVAGPLLGMGFVPGGLGTQVIDTVYTDDFALLPLIGGLLVLLTLIMNPDGVAAVAKHSLRRFFPPEPPPTPPAPSKPAETAHARPRGALAVEDLHVSFGAVHVLDGVSLTVEPGRVHGLIGPNGAGKTTLLDAVSGFAAPAAGRISLGGHSFDGVPTWQRSLLGLGRSFQSLELFDDLTVLDNIRVATRARSRFGLAGDLVRPQSDDLGPAAWQAIELLELTDQLTKKIDEVPHGVRQLVGIARALAADSDVVLLDEPAAGLDDRETAELARLVRRTVDVRGIGVLLIEHDVEFVMSVSDSVTALNFGRIVAAGPPDEVRRNPIVVDAYLGRDDSEPVVEEQV
ncbi:branched-chain amino acid ABC transporter permease/ATP-binding protein [Pseudonocardia sp. NPDC049154]|uniref:branched-chain amino acid ABC transporter permease/ATP-binding protein n=1 Tax=Pseudonocardia sp. NPDC049154 TaxID=3155501 RepID=UPI0033F30EFD